MPPLTDSSALSIGMQIMYARMLLRRLLPLLLYTRFGRKGRIPRGMGKTMRYLRLAALTPNKTPLTEGSPPAGKALSAINKDVGMSQFGDFVTLTDVTIAQVIQMLMNGELMAVMAEQAGQSVDGYAGDKLVLGTNVQYGAGRASRSLVQAGDKYTGTEALKAKRTLENANVRPWADGYYRALAHPNVLFDLRQDPRWMAANTYVDNKNIISGEEGELDGIKYYKTTQAKVWAGAGASSADVYATLIFGPDWYVTASYEAEEPGGGNPESASDDATELASIAAQIIVQALGSAGTADPLAQISTVGWKLAFELEIIDQLRGLRVETSAST